MCTLALAFQVDRRWPVVVAANRDERLHRASEGWGVREPTGAPRYVAPRDLQAGGTWIGVSERGLFAGVTNHHAPGRALDPARRSRGELVGLALAAPTAAAAREALAAGRADVWNPFHLVVADAADAFLWRFDGEEAAIETLAPGLHVVTEESPDGRCPRGELVRARWPIDPDPAGLRALLTVHGGREATCIHRDPAYGTRSATVIRLAAALEVSDLWASDGRPCTASLDDRSELLAALSRHARP